MSYSIDKFIIKMTFNLVPSCCAQNMNDNLCTGLGGGWKPVVVPQHVQPLPMAITAGQWGLLIPFLSHKVMPPEHLQRWSFKWCLQELLFLLIIPIPLALLYLCSRCAEIYSNNVFLSYLRDIKMFFTENKML